MKASIETSEQKLGVGCTNLEINTLHVLKFMVQISQFEIPFWSFLLWGNTNQKMRFQFQKLENTQIPKMNTFIEIKP